MNSNSNLALKPLKNQLKSLDTKLQKAKQLLQDPELAPLAQEEIQNLQTQKQALQQSIQTLQTHPSSADNSSTENFNQITLEVRPGAGGEEAKIWAEDLLRMYSRYAQNHQIKLELVDSLILKLSGKQLYDTLKYESGVHRVQRVPITESQGRIHTSTATVAVLPIVPPAKLQIKEEDLEWQFFRSGGKGGQNVNKVNTAVRLTHKPSGEVVTCSSERSQAQNRAIALDLLRSKLWEAAETKRLGSLDAQRRAAVGRAMRAEKIRTYNFPQNRVTDHRIKKSWHNLENILNGNLDPVLKAVSFHYRH